MKKTIDEFISNALSIYKENCIDEKEKIEIEKREKEEKHHIKESRKKDAPTIDENSPSVKRIRELGFKILSWYTEEHPYEREYYSDVEVYCCEYKGWEFNVTWMDDPDIEEGILSLNDPIEKTTGKKLSFYCDLFCNNTAQSRLEDILAVFESGYLTFMDNKYGKYNVLPELLRKQGIDANAVGLSFSISDCKGYIDVGDEVYIRIYRAWRDDIKMVVTNDSKWDVNSSNELGKIGYYFDYQSDSDVIELSLCIEAFKKHMNGEIGFKVKMIDANHEETEIYYTGQDFLNIFSNFKDEVKKKDFDKWNHRYIQYEVEDRWDGRGYSKEMRYPNSYVGLEIDETVLLSINDAAQWSVGDKMVFLEINLKYDKRLDAHNCILSVSQWITDDGERVWFNFYPEDDEIVNKKSPYYIGTVEERGTYREMAILVENLVRETVKAMGVNI